MQKFLLLGIIAFHAINIQAQKWLDKVSKSETRFEVIKKEMREYFETRPKTKSGKIPGYKQYKRWEHYMSYHLDKDGNIVNPARSFYEKQKYLKSLKKSEKSSANWTLLGPASVSQLPEGLGRIDCAAVNPNNDSIIFAGTPTGGLWKTTNRGTNWHVCSDGFTSMGISSIVMHPQNSNIVYIATGDRDGGMIYSTGVFKSMDGGNNFEPTGLQFDYSNDFARSYKLMMNPNNPDILYLASSKGFYVTSDAGVNWTKASVESNGTSLSYYEVKDFRLKPNNTNVIYAACNNNFYKSENGGSSFVKYVPVGLENLANKNTRIDVAESNPEDIYLLIEDGYLGKIYRSKDSGTSFYLLSGQPNIGGQTHYNLVLEVNPSNPDEIYAGGQYLYKTNDGGTNWSRAFSFSVSDANYCHVDFHYLEFHANILLNGNDGGLYLSSNSGDTWNNISNGLSISQFYRLGVSQTNEYLILAGAQDNGTSRFHAGIWEKILGADGMEAIIDYANPNIMYYSYQSGGILRSYDGGNTATNINGGINESGAAWVTPFVLDPTNPEIIYAAYTNLWKSFDRGDTWTKISDHTDQYQKWIAIAPSNTNYIYMTNGPNLFYTKNGGSTWTKVYLEKQANCIVVSPTNPEKLWITYSGYIEGEKVYYSDDGGSTFTNITRNLPNVPVNHIVYEKNSNDALYIGTGIGVFYKDNSSVDWTSYNSGLPEVFVSELEIQYESKKLRAATYGRGLWESPLYIEDKEDPSVPTNLTAGNVLTTSLELSWNASTDNIAVTAYDVYKDSILEKTVITTSATITGLSSGTNYSFYIIAKDAAGNESNPGNQISIQTNNGSHCNALSSSNAYEYISRVQFGSINNSSTSSGYADYTTLSTSLNACTTVQLSITTVKNYSSDELVAYLDYDGDGIFSDTNEEIYYNADAGNAQTFTANITIPADVSINNARMRIILFDSKYNTKTSCGDFNYGEVEDYTINIISLNDTEPPSAPANLSASNITQTSIKLDWDRSTDNIGVTEYEIYKGSTPIGSASITSFIATGLTAGTTYSFTIKAKDAEGNISTASNSITVSTASSTQGENTTYCNAQSTNSNYEYISRVQFGNLDHSSASSGYEDLTSINAEITAGIATKLSITTEKNYSSDEIVVYIDYNGDEDFIDPHEEVYYNADAGSANTYISNITAPMDAAGKKIRMRIILYDPTYNSKSSCGDLNYGEVEDYTIHINSPALAPVSLKQENEFTANVFPNPSNGYFTISIQNNLKGKLLFEVFNMDGQLVALKSFEKDTFFFEKDVHLDVEPGIYNIKLRMGTENVIKLIIIK